MLTHGEQIYDDGQIFLQNGWAYFLSRKEGQSKISYLNLLILLGILLTLFIFLP